MIILILEAIKYLQIKTKKERKTKRKLLYNN